MTPVDATTLPALPDAPQTWFPQNWKTIPGSFPDTTLLEDWVSMLLKLPSVALQSSQYPTLNLTNARVCARGHADIVWQLYSKQQVLGCTSLFNGCHCRWKGLCEHCQMALAALPQPLETS
jgi:hypothetical protein